MRRKDPDALQKLRQDFEAGGDRRPPLYQWMASNYDELVTLFEGARLNWQRLTASFQELGFRNGSGGDLRPETVRQTWYRVRKQKEAGGARKTGRPAPVEVLSSPTPVSSPPPAPSPTTSAADPLAALMDELNKRSGRE
jgi:hypothetical protein